MKKLYQITASVLSALLCGTAAIPVYSAAETEYITDAAEQITDIEQIREMFTKYIADNDLDAGCVSDEAYPQYAGTVVVEFNAETPANRSILEYAEQNHIERTAFNLIPCIYGKPLTTVNPDMEITTTTTTAAEAEMITNIGQMREMLNIFVAEQQIDAKIVSSTEYPGYQPIVVEFDRDRAPDAGRIIFDYIKQQNMDRTKIGMVRIENGVAITTVNPLSALKGDVDLNECVQIADAILLARWIAEDGVTITPQGKENADLNGDGHLNADDSASLLAMLAG